MHDVLEAFIQWCNTAHEEKRFTPLILAGSPHLFLSPPSSRKKNNNYYYALELANKGNEITKWLEYFLPTIIGGQQYSIHKIDFIIQKGKLLNKHQHHMNERQLRVVLRMFQEGVEGFKSRLSAKNYISITQISQQTK